MKNYTKLFILPTLVVACNVPADLPLDQIVLPEGFKIEIYAEGVENARQMALGANGTLFVGSRKKGNVYAVTDSDGDQNADQVRVIGSDLKMPSGLEFRNGSLFVGAVSKILRYDDIEQTLDSPPAPVVVIDTLPTEEHHGWKYLRFGPDGMLYIPIGAPCNVCDEQDHMQIRRMQSDGSGMEVFSRGVRNSVGLAFHPDTGELWFTDNGRDLLGDELPSDELNHAPKAGMHFGFPYCHQGDTLDPEFGEGKSCSDYEPPALNLGAHVASLGLTFYTGNMFPDKYQNQLFVAEHGSWNRSEKIGYRLKLVRFDDDGNVIGQEVFAQGWLQGDERWGRPNDVLVMPDGALLVSDDMANVIYRISYEADD
ncbi:MAG: glucose/arabinose dehydrogenase [Lysobacterales bacterium]|jgi:glucose/arabinose dehydrogenase